MSKARAKKKQRQRSRSSAAGADVGQPAGDEAARALGGDARTGQRGGDATPGQRSGNATPGQRGGDTTPRHRTGNATPGRRGGEGARGNRGSPDASTPPRRKPARFEVRDGVARPQAIWAPFPLTEIGMAVGIVIFAVGFESDGPRSTWLMGVGAVVLVVVVGEQCLREHFAGFRSHALLLAVLASMALHALVFFAITDAWRGPPTVAVDVALATALGWFLRGRFRSAHERALALQ